MVAAKKADFEQIAQEFGISPVLARLIRNRDMTTEEEIRQYLHGTLKVHLRKYLNIELM